MCNCRYVPSCLKKISSLRERRTVSALSPAAFIDSPPLLAYRFLLALSAASGVEAGQEIPTLNLIGDVTSSYFQVD